MSARRSSTIWRNPEGPIPFPGLKQQSQPRIPADGEAVLEGLSEVSRRIDDLARELNILGYFDDPDDRPRAA